MFFSCFSFVLLCMGRILQAEAAQGPCSAYVVNNEDGTVTLMVDVDGSVNSFDYGVAFSPAEAKVTDFGFTEEFLHSHGKNGGTALDHYFEEGERISPSARYIVFGGMASREAVYQGDMAYVTFALTGQEATVAVIERSADYDNADQILEQGVRYVLRTSGEAPLATDGPNNGHAGEKQEEAGPGSETSSGSGSKQSAGDGSLDPDQEDAFRQPADASSAGLQSTADAGESRLKGNGGSVRASGTDTADREPVGVYLLLSALGGILLFSIGKKQEKDF